MIPSYVAALCLLGALGPRGLLADALGRELPEIRGYWGRSLALTLATYPYVFLLVAAAAPPRPGARGGVAQPRPLPSTTFRRVTLPALRPSLGAGALLVALYVLSDFGVVSLMNYDALTRAIFLQYRSLFDRHPPPSLALVLVALDDAAPPRRGSRAPPRPPLPDVPGAGRRAAPAARPLADPRLAFCGLMASFLALPASVLGYWLARGLDDDRGVECRDEAVNSVLSSAWPRCVAVVAALPIALLVVRYRSRWRLLERSPSPRTPSPAS